MACVAIDECDKMLSLGFKPQLDCLAAALLPLDRRTKGAAEGTIAPAVKHRKKKEQAAKDESQLLVPVVGGVSSRRERPQVLMVSATVSAEAAEAAATWLAAGAQRVVAKGDAGPADVSSTVRQVVQVCAQHKKPAKLLKHLHAIAEASKGLRAKPRVLIFCNKISVRYMYKAVHARLMPPACHPC